MSLYGVQIKSYNKKVNKFSLRFSTTCSLILLTNFTEIVIIGKKGANGKKNSRKAPLQRITLNNTEFL